MTLYIYHNGIEYLSLNLEKLLKLNQPSSEMIEYNGQYWFLYEKRVYEK